MKTFKLNLLGLALAGLILGACSQTGTYETADLMNEQAADKAGFKLTPFGSGNENARTYGATDCVAFCIDPAAPEYSYQESTISNNSGPNTRVFTYTVHNTLTGFELAWNYAATNNAGRKLRITVSGAGFSSSQTHTSPQYNGTNAGGTHTFTFDASWAACGLVTVQAEILDGDNVLISGPNTTEYSLIGECVVGCDDKFSGATTCTIDGSMRTVTFTFTAGDDATYKIQGGLTAFITDVLVDGATVIRETGQGNNIISWTGDLDECDVKIINVTWNSTNGDALITGDWTVEKDGEEILTLDELECNDSGEGYAPEVI